MPKPGLEDSPPARGIYCRLSKCRRSHFARQRPPLSRRRRLQPRRNASFVSLGIEPPGDGEHVLHENAGRRHAGQVHLAQEAQRFVGNLIAGRDGGPVSGIGAHGRKFCMSLQIAAVVGMERPTITNWLSEKSADAEFALPPAFRQHFDIWQFQRRCRNSGILYHYERR